MIGVHMTNSAVQEQAVRQALAEGTASARLEGYVPTQAFEKDCAAIIAGALTFEQARANALARAQQGKLG